MGKLKYILGPMRLPFLVLAPACVLIGLGTAVWTPPPSHPHPQEGVKALHFILALIGALAAHISVNSFNEYFDFKSGLDFKTERTPFSGGSGTLPEKPEFAGWALATAVISLVITAAVGGYFVWLRGVYILPLGLLGLAVIVAYTPLLARMPVFSLIAPGLGFGPLMVMGTDFALTGTYTWTAFCASLVPFFLVNDLLLLNQFPDVEADKTVGRKNFPIIIGRRASSVIYAAFLSAAFASIVVGYALGYLPVTALIGLGALVVAVPAGVGAYRYAEDTKALTPYMGLNVVTNLLTPVLVAVGLLLA